MEVEVAEQSVVLNEEEVAATLAGEELADAGLPSDEVAFEMPEKFAGKSAEEIAKSYLELEKFKAKSEDPVPEEGGDALSKEEAPEKEPTKEEAAAYEKYVEAYDKNGSLSEAEYSELAEAGYTKEQVDEEIEYRTYKKEKTLKDILEPLGGGTEKFKEVSAWANEAKTTDELKAFNEALAAAPKMAQQALLKQLYSEFEAGKEGSPEPLHTNSTQTQPSKGYGSESELFADMNNPAYSTDPKFNKKVMEKLGRTDKEGWTF